MGRETELAWGVVKINSGLRAQALESDSLFVNLGIATHKLCDLEQVTKLLQGLRFFIYKLGK